MCVGGWCASPPIAARVYVLACVCMHISADPLNHYSFIYLRKL